MKPQEQIALASCSVEKVVNILPELLSLTKTYKGKHSSGVSKKTAATPKYKAFSKALGKLAKRYGFKDAKPMQKLAISL